MDPLLSEQRCMERSVQWLLQSVRNTFNLDFIDYIIAHVRQIYVLNSLNLTYKYYTLMTLTLKQTQANPRRCSASSCSAGVLSNSHHGDACPPWLYTLHLCCHCRYLYGASFVRMNGRERGQCGMKYLYTSVLQLV